MLKYSKNCEGAEDLQEALTSILGILKAVNDSMHQIAITGYDVSNSIFTYFLIYFHLFLIYIYMYSIPYTVY